MPLTVEAIKNILDIKGDVVLSEAVKANKIYFSKGQGHNFWDLKYSAKKRT